MKFRFPSKDISLCLLALQFTLPSLAQYSSDSDSEYLMVDVGTDTAIPPFYQELDEKSYYHSRQIHGMKQDMNAHSRNLRDLRMRFNQVFYGRKTSNGVGDPFQVGAVPQMPEKTEVKPRIVYVPPPPRRSRDRYEPPQTNANLAHETQVVSNEETNPAHLLAFSVKEPGSYQSHDGQPVSPDAGMIQGNRISNTPRKFDYYILTRAGLAFAPKIKKELQNYRRYDPGYSLSISGGVRMDPWRMGLEFIHQRNELHSSSWRLDPSTGSPSVVNGKTSTNALLVDLSYLIPVTSSLEIILNGALGYRDTKSYARWNGQSGSVNDDGFVWSAGTGLNWILTEQASLLLAYRYFAEEIVPTHNVDLGLEFDF
jgi:hypothetical protein